MGPTVRHAFVPQVHQRCGKALPSGVDGKALLRWSLQKCTTFCNGDEKQGLLVFNGLRLEVDRVAASEKEKRAQVMARKK